jgi:integrase
MRSFARHIAPRAFDGVTLVDLEDFLADKPAPRSRHAYRSDLRAFYAWAVKRDLLASNPAAELDPIKTPKGLPRPIGDGVHVAVRTGRLNTRRMVALGLYAGLRAGEIVALHTDDVDLRHDPPLLVVRNGKGGKDRTVPLHPVLVDLLRDVPAPGPVIARVGRPITAGSCSATIAAHLKRCGIHATAHQLRHSFGTEMARASRGNLVMVAAAMGHESMQTTRGYVGWSGESAPVIASMFSG